LALVKVFETVLVCVTKGKEGGDGVKCQTLGYLLKRFMMREKRKENRLGVPLGSTIKDPRLLIVETPSAVMKCRTMNDEEISLVVREWCGVFT
jgi:hypothetical protein